VQSALLTFAIGFILKLTVILSLTQYHCMPPNLFWLKAPYQGSGLGLFDMFALVLTLLFLWNSLPLMLRAVGLNSFDRLTTVVSSIVLLFVIYLGIWLYLVYAFGIKYDAIKTIFDAGGFVPHDWPSASSCFAASAAG